MIGVVAAVLSVVLSQSPHPCDSYQQSQAQVGVTLRVGFCSLASTLTSYTVFVGGLPQSTGVPQKISSTPNTAGLWYYETSQTVQLPEGIHTITLQVANGTILSPYSAGLQLPVAPAAQGCAATDMPSVFVTRWEMTTGKPGSQMRVNYQLASSSPIVKVEAKIAGAVVRVVTGSDLTGTAGLWFTTPATGTYKMSVAATNALGCSREVLSPVDLRVK